MRELINKKESSLPGASSMLYMALVIAIPIVGYSTYNKLLIVLILFGYIGLLLYDYLQPYFKYKKCFLMFNLFVFVTSYVLTSVFSENVERPITIIVVVLAYLASIVNNRIFAIYEPEETQ